jgi:hypothetical protein
VGIGCHALVNRLSFRRLLTATLPSISARVLFVGARHPFESENYLRAPAEDDNQIVTIFILLKIATHPRID